MSFPPDVSLPTNSKYYYYRDNTTYNSNYDIVWSIKYQLSGNIANQAGIASFITPATNNLSVIPGHYLCTQSEAQSGNNNTIIKTATSRVTAKPLNIISVAIDTTGYYALSTNIRSGAHISAVSANSLIVRDYNNSIIFNTPLSSLGYTLTTEQQTLRYRYSNAEQTLTLDYKVGSNTEYSPLATISIPFRIINEANIDNVATGFTFCSPVSTNTANRFLNMVVENYHVEGTSNNTAVTTIEPTPIS